MSRKIDRNRHLILIIWLVPSWISGWGQEIKDLKFSNLSSRSVVVSWLTTEAVPSRLEYGQTTDLGQILTSTDLKRLHWLEVGKLTPETQYYFAVMAGNTVAHGSLQTARVGAGVPYTLYGQLMSSSQNLVPTALVAVSAINNSDTP